MSLLLLWLGGAFAADEVVYDDELGPNWYSWSWTADVDLSATGNPHSGATSMYGALSQHGALSLYRATGFGNASAIRFWIRGEGEVSFRVESFSEGIIADELPLELQDNEWTEVIFSLDALEPFAFDRMSWVDTSGVGAIVRVDSVELLEVDPTILEFRAVEPLPPERIMLLGNGDVSQVQVSLDGVPVDIERMHQEGGPTRTYLKLATPLTAGELTVETADGTFTRTLVGATAGALGGDVASHQRPDLRGELPGVAAPCR